MTSRHGFADMLTTDQSMPDFFVHDSNNAKRHTEMYAVK